MPVEAVTATSLDSEADGGERNTSGQGATIYRCQ